MNYSINQQERQKRKLQFTWTVRSNFSTFWLSCSSRFFSYSSWFEILLIWFSNSNFFFSRSCWVFNSRSSYWRMFVTPICLQKSVKILKWKKVSVRWPASLVQRKLKRKHSETNFESKLTVSRVFVLVLSKVSQKLGIYCTIMLVTIVIIGPTLILRWNNLKASLASNKCHNWKIIFITCLRQCSSCPWCLQS